MTTRSGGLLHHYAALDHEELDSVRPPPSTQAISRAVPAKRFERPGHSSLSQATADPPSGNSPVPPLPNGPTNHATSFDPPFPRPAGQVTYARRPDSVGAQGR